MSWKLRLFKARNYAKRARQWLEAYITFGILAVLKLLPMHSAIATSSKLVQFIGPRLQRQKVVVDNLTNAYPEKDADEIQQIARATWRNIGRLIAEYVFVDQLFDYDPDSKTPGIIEVEGREIFERIKASGKPVIFFTGHIGNFELLPICAATFGLEVTALFRPPNNPYVAKRLLAARETKLGHLVPAKAGAAWGLAKALDSGTSIGVLVDQKFWRGTHTSFYGNPVRTNPLLAKLARQFEVPVHPVRCVRLNGGRFKLILEDELPLPRNAQGEIDVEATSQALNDKVEEWVRETPAQWMWMHKRWDSFAARDARNRKKIARNPN